MTTSMSGSSSGPGRAQVYGNAEETRKSGRRKRRKKELGRLGSRA
jgi:hypothetical protein